MTAGNDSVVASSAVENPAYWRVVHSLPLYMSRLHTRVWGNCRHFSQHFFGNDVRSSAVNFFYFNTAICSYFFHGKFISAMFMSIEGVSTKINNMKVNLSLPIIWYRLLLFVRHLRCVTPCNCYKNEMQPETHQISNLFELFFNFASLLSSRSICTRVTPTKA